MHILSPNSVIAVIFLWPRSQKRVASATLRQAKIVCVWVRLPIALRDRRSIVMFAGWALSSRNRRWMAFAGVLVCFQPTAPLRPTLCFYEKGGTVKTSSHRFDGILGEYFRRRSLRALIAFAGLGAAALPVLHAYLGQGSAKGAMSERAPFANIDHDAPLRLGPLAKGIFPSSSAQARLIRQLRDDPPRLPKNPAGLCHVLRLVELSPTGTTGLPSGFAALRNLTDIEASREFFGETPLAASRYGVRMLMPDAGNPKAVGEAHRDQCLATFAELGLPLSHPLNLGTKPSRMVRDLLNDSLATFDLQARELTWTAMAYTLYLPPTRQWHNRDGVSFCFDDLATELMRRDPDEGSCGGTHVLMALTLIYRADQARPLLSTGSRSALGTLLETAARTAVASQDASGAWRLNWREVHDSRVSETPFNQLLITGHLLEWLQYLPETLQPPSQTYARGSQWLLSVLPTHGTIDHEHFCPWTHAQCSLRNLVIGSPEQVVSDVAPSLYGSQLPSDASALPK